MQIFESLLTQPLANGLVVFYRLLGQNLGLGIIGFTLFLILALTPLVKPSMNAAKKIRAIQPEIAKLKKKYANDRQGLMKAQADLYKVKGINPTAGCLPQIIQLVILIAFYSVFTRLLSGHGTISSEFNELLYAPLKFEEGYRVNTQFLYLDVTQPDKFAINGLPFPLPGVVLIVAALVQFVSAKIAIPYVSQEEKVAETTKSEVDDFAVAMQSSMVYYLPLTTILFGIGFPSGLALYWCVFSIVSAVRQYNNFGWGGLTPWVKKLGIKARASSV